MAACKDRVPIKWNLSTDVGRSKTERLYEYPMFTEVAPSPCDLTAGVCDIGCCVDPDCDVHQKKLFNCSTVTGPCTRPFSRYDCNCPSDRPFWFSALCYVYENPVYLGLFYKTLSKIEDIRSFLARANAKDYKYEGVGISNRGKRYKFGSVVSSFVFQNGSLAPARHALLSEKNPLPGGSCHAPVRYMRDSRRSCYVRLTQENCENGFVLGAGSYLLGIGESSSSPNIPVILKNLETEEPAKVDIAVKYSSYKTVSKRVRGRFHEYLIINGDLHESGTGLDLFKTFSNGTHCYNVIARAVFKFVTNATEILNVNVLFVLANVLVTRGQSGYEMIYLKKEHVVSFTDVGAGREVDAADDYPFNRGYHEGESLNFGFNRTNGSHTYWEKGELKIFLNGGACNRTAGITFGYDSYGRCLFRSTASNCSRVREEVRLKLDSLIRGEFLAPYANYRMPRKSAVPLLRNYNNTYFDDLNSTGCALPVQQDVYVEFTTAFTSKGHPVHRAVGLMVNRTLAKVKNLTSFKLTTHVIFLRVETEYKKPLSRFWQRVYSPEHSENSWLNIFNVFDRPLSGEELEESFFWILLPAVVMSAMLMLMQNNRRESCASKMETRLEPEKLVSISGGVTFPKELNM